MVSQHSCERLKIQVYENFMYTFSNQKPLASKKRHLDLSVRHGFFDLIVVWTKVGKEI